MGKLFIVATPIGNLGDITHRALLTLQNSDLILCEDTRTTSQMLRHFDISKPLLSLHDQNEQFRIPAVLDKLKTNQNISLVSENGTPLISDPGYKLVREASKSGVAIESIPGPSSVINSLVLSGLPPDKFFFVGFWPKKTSHLVKLLEEIQLFWSRFSFTVISFESPFRLRQTLLTVKQTLDDPYVVVTREMTKTYQEILRGRSSELLARIEKKNIKGEVVLLLNPKDPFKT